MTAKKTAASKARHPWSKDALLAKAQLYAEEMVSHPHDDWRFGLMSTFVLEFLLRAALANISPTLLADPKGWENIYYALGHNPKRGKFVARSVDTGEVVTRLAGTISSFTTELQGFAARHLNRRNEEFHTGDAAFTALPEIWLPQFYEMVFVLLSSVDEKLSFLLGPPQAAVATRLIRAFKDESAKSVQQSISAHQHVWQAKDPQERKMASAQAEAWATRQAGHRVVCPSCSSPALVFGEPYVAPTRKLDGDMIVEVQEYLPSKFECVACGLKISGLSHLNAAGLSSPYNKKSTYDPATYYAEPEDDYRGYEDDNNEY